MSQSWKVSLVLVCSLAVGSIYAFAGSDPALVRKALQRHPNAAAAKESPLTAFSMQGISHEAGMTDGTCGGTQCMASLGDCVCLTFQGTLAGTLIGKADWTAGVTVNIDDCTNTGTAGGFCCAGDGTFSATDGAKSPDTLAMSFAGTVCDDPNAKDDFSASGTFIILPSSTGKFVQSAGTGQLNLYSPAAGTTSYVAGDGLIQLVSPL